MFFICLKNNILPFLKLKGFTFLTHHFYYESTAVMQLNILLNTFSIILKISVTKLNIQYKLYTPSEVGTVVAKTNLRIDRF